MTISLPLVRSMLFVPAVRTEWVAKAVVAGADAVILDLEDAVSAHRKSEAREAVREFLRGQAPPLSVFVRVHAPESSAVLADLDAVVSPGLAGVMVPKVTSPRDVAVVDRLLSWHEHDRGLPAGGIRLVPVLETATGMRRAHKVARASARCAYMGGLGVRGGDVERALGYRWTPEGQESLFIRSSVLLAVRSAGVPNPVSGLWSDVEDLDGLRHFADQNRNLGYEGMMVIHPSHVATVNEVFTPSDADLERDRGLLRAFADAVEQGQGAITFEGHMVDEAMVKTARTRLARFAQD